ncbi:DNA/RNA non-specific endonuclease [Sphingomonas sp. R-74633]|uniref:DNA/RNA non-specific endonuclease n=1 Tax=Sphingomonas sp. R-74633 TaxID=2751188 RepID=UPI00359FD9BF
MEAARSVEVKFNPWHDPRNGQFTFAGAGQSYGQGGQANARTARAAGRRSQDASKVTYVEQPALPPINSMAEVETWRTRERSKHAGQPDYLKAIDAQYERYKAFFSAKTSLNQLGKFAGSGVAGGTQGDGDARAGGESFGGSGATGSRAGGAFAGGGGSFGGGGASGTWEDPRFVGGGGSGGGGGATSSWEEPRFVSGGGSFAGSGATSSWEAPGFVGGGGSFGGGGATGSWEAPRFVGGGGSGGGGGATGGWDTPRFGGGGSFGGGGATGSWVVPRFVGGGGSFGGGGATGSWTPAPSSTKPQKPTPTKPNLGFGGAGATASWSDSGRNDNKFGGAGSSGSWSGAAPKLPNSPTQTRPQLQQASARSRRPEQFRHFERNGYEYQIDSAGRTRQVSGTLMLSQTQVRSRTAQEQAGGSDRRRDDDGGHYIAARFNGPSDAFNHFAQNANFNRGAYRRLEDEWARSQRAGKRVIVNIVPHYRGASQRPTSIVVRYTTNGHRSRKRFWNERKGIENAEQ